MCSKKVVPEAAENTCTNHALSLFQINFVISKSMAIVIAK